MFNKLKEKITNYLKNDFDDKITIFSDQLPFDLSSKYNYCTENISDFKDLDLRDCKYEVFKCLEQSGPNYFSYMVVGTANFENGQSERFIVSITESDFEKILSHKNEYEQFNFGKIDFNEKADLINSFGIDEIKQQEVSKYLIADFIKSEIDNGTTYEEVLNKFSDIRLYEGDWAYLKYLNKDSEGKTILDAAEGKDSHLYDELRKNGYLSSSELDNYNEGKELRECNALRVGNYSFDSDFFVGKKTEIDNDVINYKYDNVVMINKFEFLIKGVKEFEDSSKNQEFVEFVNSDKALALMAREVNIMYDKTPISREEKIDIMLESGVADWEILYKKGVVSEIGDFSFGIYKDALNKLDCNGNTALDVVLKEDLVTASELMDAGALTGKEIIEKLEQEKIKENINDNGNEFDD